jgi:ribosomal protein S18 acetylase RimI-like enzyme
LSRGPTIRDAAAPSDIAVVRGLFLEYAGSLGVDLGFQDFGAELDGLPGGYAPPQGALLLAEEAGEALGCVAMRPLQPPEIAELKRLYVRPAARGKGLGKALTLAILERARAAGYRRIRLDTLPTMREAQQMYQAMGFYQIPAYRHNPVPGTTYLELSL